MVPRPANAGRGTTQGHHARPAERGHANQG